VVPVGSRSSRRSTGLSSGIVTALTPARKRLIFRVAAVAIGIAIVVMVVRTIQRDGPAAVEAWRNAQIQWSWISVAVIGALAGHVVWTIGWRRLLRDMGISTTLWPLLRIYLVSNLGRYLPGAKAWQMGVVYGMATEAGMPGGVVAATSLFQGVVGVGVGMILLLAFGGAALAIAPILFVLPVLGAIAVLFLPAALKAMPKLHAIALARVPGFDAVTASTMWALLWTSVASWLAWGLAFYALAHGLLADTVAPLTTYLAAWISSLLAGIIVVIAPAGVGVRDNLMQALLVGAGVSAGSGIVVVAIARVWATALEVVPAVIVLALRRKKPAVPETVQTN
jgi:uncharacterized membrane protein YbhN (UPF0104 family)